jgi:hypothetical protein
MNGGKDVMYLVFSFDRHTYIIYQFIVDGIEDSFPITKVVLNKVI